MPCSRCAEKNISCEARYARRGSKASQAASSSTESQAVPAQDIAHQRDEMDLDTFENSNFLRQQGSPEDHPNFMHQHQYPFPIIESDGNTMQYIENMSKWGMVVAVDGYDGSIDQPEYENFVPHNSNHEGVTSWHGSYSDFGVLDGSDKTFPEDANPTVGSLASDSSTMYTEFESNVFDDVLSIEEEEEWPLGNCNPRTVTVSRFATASIHLQNFQQNTNSDDVWQAMGEMLSLNQRRDDNQLAIVPMVASTRDKILATAQSFLQKALNTQNVGLNSTSSTQSNSGSSIGLPYFALPPSNVLEDLLRSYVNSLKPYYNLNHGGVLDPNEMLLENQASTLLVLLMLAQGATSVSMPEARYLSTGLTETCRVSLFDLIEKNMASSADPTVLKSALLFTILGAWGGDGRHIHFAMGQRGMYLAVSRILSKAHFDILSVCRCSNTLEC